MVADGFLHIGHQQKFTTGQECIYKNAIQVTTPPCYNIAFPGKWLIVEYESRCSACGMCSLAMTRLA